MGDEKKFNLFKHFVKAKRQLQRKNEQTNIANEDQNCGEKKENNSENGPKTYRYK